MNEMYKWFWGNILGRKEFHSGYASKKGIVITLYIYVSAFLGYNFNLVWIYIKYFTGFDIQAFLGITTKTGGLLLSFGLIAVFFVFNYFFLLRNDKYEIIIHDFTSTMKKKKISKEKEKLQRISVLLGFIFITILNLYIVTEIL